jgi:hypothetical protein
METIGPPTIFYMKFTFISLALASCFLNGTLVTSVRAENWKSVGDGFYVDVDSAKRRGDIGTIRVRYKGEHSLAEFDCKNKLYIPKNAEPFSFDESSFLGEMIKIACTKWYEVWKK